ncbi:MAG TPA: hypothetical protein VET86_12320, partial [Casimicrobiaceae bacterium]|nr:hypothetical protein [Casimicrobiaceae bacterium]
APGRVVPEPAPAATAEPPTRAAPQVPAPAATEAAPPSGAPSTSATPAPPPGAGERVAPPAEIAPSRPAPLPPAEPRIRFGTPPSPEEEIFKPRKPGTEVESVLPIGKAPGPDLRTEEKAVAGRSEARKGVLNLFPPPPAKDSKLARDIRKAGQPDCRDAYAGMGLLGALPLLWDTMTDTGCRW